MDWTGYILAFGFFFVTHSVPVRPPLRPWLVDRLGTTGFTLAYSALSLGALGVVIHAAGTAPFVPLWDWAPWQNHVTLGVMLAVCLLLALSIGRPNPFSFGGWRNDRFDPRRPGLVRITRHPLLVALALWAVGHMVPNGDLAHVILFGTFALFALLGQRLVDRRRRREMGAAWEAGVNAVRKAPRAGRIDRSAVLRLGAGVLLWAVLIAAHPLVIGVDPLP